MERERETLMMGIELRTQVCGLTRIWTGDLLVPGMTLTQLDRIGLSVMLALNGGVNF